MPCQPGIHTKWRQAQQLSRLAAIPVFTSLGANPAFISLGHKYLPISVVEKISEKNKGKPLARLRERGRGEGVRPQDESRQAGQIDIFCPPPSLRDTSSRKREEGLSTVFKKIFSCCEMGRNLIIFSVFLPILHIPKNGIWIAVNKFYMVFV